MASRDLYNQIAPTHSLLPATRTATANGTGVDTTGYEAVVVLIELGTFAGTSPTATVQIQESSDNSTYTAVATGDLQGGALPAIDTTTDDQVLERGYLGTKRYVRAAITAIGGTSPSLPCSAVVVRGSAAKNPA